VRGRNRHGDEVALTVRQPDVTLAQLPIWMTEDQAAAMKVTQIPRLSLAVYANSVSSSIPGKACCATAPVAKETSMPPRQQPRHRQPDLFAPKDPPVPIAASERRKLLPLVSALLAETLAIIVEAETSDEDHA
jgi:hypothetical protein